MSFAIKTVPYKGSKKKLLPNILYLAKEINAKTAFDGFSGTGVVSAFLRSNNIVVYANDISPSSALYGRVFLKGFDVEKVKRCVERIENIRRRSGWVTKNYSGEKKRVIRGTNGQEEIRPLPFTKRNAQKIDVAWDYLIKASKDIEQKNIDAMLFSVILGANKVFNNTNDQKSALKKWAQSALKDISFPMPSLISGPVGFQYNENLLQMEIPEVDFVYYDPPYTTGVLYPACYHFNDTLTLMDKVELDHSYAIPRPIRASFKGKDTFAFYGKKTAKEDFAKLIEKTNAKRIVFSYSDAPRNSISIEDLVKVSEKAKPNSIVSIKNVKHRICSQPNSLNKISEKLLEYFIIIDREK